MTRYSMSNTTPEQDRPWLQQHYQAVRERTVRLVKAAVDRLVKDGRAVTIEAICQQSQQLDPQDQQHRPSHAATSRRASHKAGRTHRLPTDPGRDPGAVRRRYLRERKPDLVERLLFVEQAYIESQQQLARLQFELLDQQQKTQKGREGRSF